MANNLKPFAVMYHHMGKDYTIEVYATDPQDAKNRIRSAYFNGQVQEIVASVEVPAWLGGLITGIS